MREIAVLVAMAVLILSNGQPAFAQVRQQGRQDLKNLTEEVKSLRKDVEEIKEGVKNLSEEKRLRKEVQELREGQSALQKQLQELMQSRQAAPAPPQPSEPQVVVLTTDGAPFMGDQNAKVTIFEFADYQCPFCARHFKQTLPQLKEEYVKTGKIKYVFRDFPIETLHPHAFKAAEATHCAGEQGKYWEMHDRLLSNQATMGRPDLPKHAEALGMTLPDFEQCLDSEKYASKVRAELAAGTTAGVNGTPTFFLGLTEPDGSTVKTTRVIRGAQSYAGMKAAIDAVLGSDSK